MMTKKQFAECLVLLNARRISCNSIKSFEDINPEDYVKYVFESTELGIGLEYLGFIGPEKHPSIYEYLRHRGGTTKFMYSDLKKFPNDDDNFPYLCIRDILSLLPESM